MRSYAGQDVKIISFQAQGSTRHPIRPSAVSACGRSRVTRAIHPPSVPSRCLVRHPRRPVNRRDLLRLRRLSEPPPYDPAHLGHGRALDLIKASRPAMGSYFEVRLGRRHPRRGRAGEPGARPDRRPGVATDGLPRRLGGQPAERLGAPRAGRGRARPVPAARARRCDRSDDARGVRRDGRSAVGGLGLLQGTEARPRPRDAGRRAGADRPAPPDARPRAGPSPSTDPA